MVHAVARRFRGACCFRGGVCFQGRCRLVLPPLTRSVRFRQAANRQNGVIKGRTLWIRLYTGRNVISLEVLFRAFRLSSPTCNFENLPA